MEQALSGHASSDIASLRTDVCGLGSLETRTSEGAIGKRFLAQWRRPPQYIQGSVLFYEIVQAAPESRTERKRTERSEVADFCRPLVQRRLAAPSAV